MFGQPFGIILAAFLAAWTTTAHARTAPLRLALACSRPAGSPFRLTIQNIDNTPTAVVIGSVLGNDRKYLPRGLQFTLRRDGMADTEVDWFDPSVAGVAGRIDPWLVPLPAGTSYSIGVLIPESLRHFFSTPAAVRVRLTTQTVPTLNPDLEGLRFIHVWAGTLTSDWIPLPGDCHPE